LKRFEPSSFGLGKGNGWSVGGGGGGLGGGGVVGGGVWGGGAFPGKRGKLLTQVLL